MKNNKFISFAVCLSLTMIITLLSSAFLPIHEQKVYDSVIRLHVIANSDSDTDQQVKLKVRDAILLEAGHIFSGKTMDEALEISTLSTDELTAIARQVLAENGLDYNVRVELGKEDYPTREYDGQTYPAGKYYSLRVVLGEGKGQNWWCVLFPPLCFGSSGIIIRSGDSEGKTIIPKGSKIKFKLKILEIFR